MILCLFKLAITNIYCTRWVAAEPQDHSTAKQLPQSISVNPHLPSPLPSVPPRKSAKGRAGQTVQALRYASVAVGCVASLPLRAVESPSAGVSSSRARAGLARSCSIDALHGAVTSSSVAGPGVGESTRGKKRVSTGLMVVTQAQTTAMLTSSMVQIAIMTASWVVSTVGLMMRILMNWTVRRREMMQMLER